MENIINWLDTKYIDFTLVILVIASGFLQAKFLSPFTWFKKDPRYDATLKTFAVSFVLCGIYTWLVKHEANLAPESEQVQGITWLKIFISYTIATSFYDLILRLFKIAVKQKTGQDIDEITDKK